uniref:Uncharacterized protein n=1 Tax=Arundo donax TaxID=35708 RepID=A0A0A9H2T8_ARUDO
MGISGDGR